MKYKINNNISWEYAGDKEKDDVIVLNAEKESVFIINQSALFVLEKIGENFSVEEIITEASRIYLIDPTTIRDEILQIIETFLERGFIFKS